MPALDDLKVFTGNAHPTLAKDICAYLGISLGRCEVFKFKNDNTFVRFQENIRESDVFLVQSISAPVGKIGNHSRYAPRRCSLGGVDHNEQFHDVIIHGR